MRNIEIYASNGICAGSVDNLASVGKQFLANGFANCVRTALSAKYLNAILREFAIASHYGHTADECCCYYYSIGWILMEIRKIRSAQQNIVIGRNCREPIKFRQVSKKLLCINRDNDFPFLLESGNLPDGNR